MLSKYGFVYLQKIQNQLEAKINKRSSGGLCERHMLSQISINVNWEIQWASMLCKPNMQHESVPQWMLQNVGIGSMGFSILRYARELVIHFFCLWTMILGISKVECCGALFYFQCNKLETLVRFRSYCSCQTEV